MAKKHEEIIVVLQQKNAQTKESVLVLSGMHGKLKSDGIDEQLELMMKERLEKIELLTQHIVQIKEDYAKSRNLIARVDSLWNEFQFKVDECRKELIKQRKVAIRHHPNEDGIM